MAAAALVAAAVSPAAGGQPVRAAADWHLVPQAPQSEWWQLAAPRTPRSQQSQQPQPQQPGPQQQHSHTLAPIADTFVTSAHPDLNRGSWARLKVEASASATLRSYLTFDVAHVRGRILSATLRLYVTNRSPDGGQVYATSQPWSESATTWSNAPAFSRRPLARIGRVRWKHWVDVKLPVRDLAATDGAFGFMLASRNSDRAAYSSREGAHPPRLVLTTDQ